MWAEGEGLINGCDSWDAFLADESDSSEGEYISRVDVNNDWILSRIFYRNWRMLIESIIVSGLFPNMTVLYPASSI